MNNKKTLKKEQIFKYDRTYYADSNMANGKNINAKGENEDKKALTQAEERAMRHRAAKSEYQRENPTNDEQMYKLHKLQFSFMLRTVNSMKAHKKNLI